MTLANEIMEDFIWSGSAHGCTVWAGPVREEVIGRIRIKKRLGELSDSSGL
jgi:hypothetical protein